MLQRSNEMNKFRLKVISLLITLSCLNQSVIAAEMISFESWLKATPNWAKDESEVAYVFTRCGILLSVVGIYFLANGTKDKDKLNGQSFIDNGNNLIRSGVYVSLEKGINQDAIKQRHKVINDTYINDIKNNKSINNTIFFGDTGKDFEFCTSLNNSMNSIKKN